MCRNYDGGKCIEEGCTNRVTCHDFWDHKCRDHTFEANIVFEDDYYDPESPVLNSVEIGVHTRHCCKQHGCKYDNSDCPVELGYFTQEYPCEFCPTVEEARQHLADAKIELDFAILINARLGTKP